jgi:hypothetical protein
MSKKAKSEAKKRRRAKKRAYKAAQRARYEAWKLAGQNAKSKRANLRKRRDKGVRSVRHPLGPCGNVGCATCNPITQNLPRRSVRRPAVQ